MPTEKKICVIGASGVVGSHVVQAALRKGYRVRNVHIFCRNFPYIGRLVGT